MNSNETLTSTLQSSIGNIVEKYPNARWKDVFRENQLESKSWLVKQLQHWDTDLGIVYICGGWYGVLSSMLFISKLPINRIYSYDIDPFSTQIANDINSFVNPIASHTFNP